MRQRQLLPPLRSPEGPVARTGGDALERRSARSLIRVGALARETGKTVRAIHLYEELGLLTPGGRSKGGFRLYSPEARVRIQWISKLQEMGFSLGDIQAVVRDLERIASAPDAMKRIRAIYARKLQDTLDQARRLEVLRRELDGSIAYLDTCDVCEPQRLLSECSRCGLHDKEFHVPELVLGCRAH
jgi:DNA-binding transcriptional MerR regulator